MKQNIILSVVCIVLTLSSLQAKAYQEYESISQWDKLLLTDMAAQDLEMTKKLLAKGANINARSPGYYGSKTTALMNAILSYDGKERTNKEIIEFLVNAGADVNARTNEGITPLFYAVSQDDSWVIEYLLDKGANPHVRTREGNNLLHRTSSLDTTNLKKLISLGVDVNAVNEDGETPLFEICRMGDLESVKLLIEAGADINFQSIKTGNTPLHVASFSTEVANYLLDHGANPNVVNRDGETPLYNTVRSYRGYGCTDDEVERQKQLIERLFEVTTIES